MASAFEITTSSVRGHHTYKELWNPVIGEVLSCEHKAGNEHDWFAIACMKEESHLLVGHLPRELARTC